jgi:uncharacterized protein YbjQ (UPF0145 family)
MILTTSDVPPGYVVTEVLGIVRGNIAQGTGSIGALGASLAQQESEEYTELLDGARFEAEKRMCAHARRLEADGVIDVRYNACPIGTAHAIEYLCYGTAVKMRPV